LGRQSSLRRVGFLIRRSDLSESLVAAIAATAASLDWGMHERPFLLSFMSLPPYWSLKVTARSGALAFFDSRLPLVLVGLPVLRPFSLDDRLSQNNLSFHHIWVFTQKINLKNVRKNFICINCFNLFLKFCIR